MTIRLALQHICKSSVVRSPRIPTLSKFVGEATERRCYHGISSSSADYYFDRYRTIDNRIRQTTRHWNMSTMVNGEKSSAQPMIHPTIESLRSVRKLLDPSVSVGFVPTMGALHEGNDLSILKLQRYCFSDDVQNS